VNGKRVKEFYCKNPLLPEKPIVAGSGLIEMTYLALYLKLIFTRRLKDFKYKQVVFDGLSTHAI